MWSATHESTSAAFGVGDSTVKHHIHSDGDNLKLAISAIVFTVFALSLGDALIKQISANFPLWQIFVVRSLIAIPVLVVVSFLKILIPKVGMPVARRWDTGFWLLCALHGRSFAESGGRRQSDSEQHPTARKSERHRSK